MGIFYYNILYLAIALSYLNCIACFKYFLFSCAFPHFPSVLSSWNTVRTFSARTLLSAAAVSVSPSLSDVASRRLRGNPSPQLAAFATDSGNITKSCTAFMTMMTASVSAFDDVAAIAAILGALSVSLSLSLPLLLSLSLLLYALLACSICLGPTFLLLCANYAKFSVCCCNNYSSSSSYNSNNNSNISSNVCQRQTSPTSSAASSTSTSAHTLCKLFHFIA